VDRDTVELSSVYKAKVRKKVSVKNFFLLYSILPSI